MIEWLATNWATLLGGILAVLGGASILARLTPTEVDNKVIDAILKVIKVLGLNSEE